MDPLSDPALPGLLSIAMEERDLGREPDLTAICADHPDLVDAVAASLAESQRLPSLQSNVATRDPLRGRLLGGRYRLTDRLGAGAMGVVYEAFDLELQRRVAVKVLRSLVLADDEAEVRFEREGAALAAIRHDSIVTVFDRGRTQDGERYLVMELLEGRPLSLLLEERPQGDPSARWLAQHLASDALVETAWIRQSVRWVADLVAGLNHAHESSILHRDIKPSNVFVREDGRAMLLDFGIASAPNQDTITREGAAVGTPAYMAPESLRDSKPKPALDIYGLSATLYHLVTGRPPYEGTPSQIISRLVSKDPVRASKLSAGLPRDLQAILDKGMARSPRDRYASAQELAADLHAFLEHRPVQARPISAFNRAWRTARKSSVFWTGVTLVLALAGAYGFGQVRELRAERQKRLYAAARAELLPNRDITLPEMRVVRDLELRERQLEVLGEAVRNEPGGEFHARLRRASFLWDHGERAAAAQDMSTIARVVGSPFSEALAAGYERLAGTDQTLQQGLSLAEMPAVEATPEDLYLLGYHQMRVSDRLGATETLQHELLADYMPAQDIVILYLADRPDEMYERIMVAEERLGAQTATTATLLSRCFYNQGRYTAARRHAEEGLELQSQSVPLLMNAAAPASELEDYGAAVAFYREAIRIQPGYARLRLLMIDDLLMSERVDEAAEELELARELLSEKDYLNCLGHLRARMAMRSEGEQAREYAALARDTYAELQEIDPEFTSIVVGHLQRFLSEDSIPLFEYGLEVATKKPTSQNLKLLQSLASEEEYFLLPADKLISLFKSYRKVLLEARYEPTPGSEETVTVR